MNKKVSKKKVSKKKVYSKKRKSKIATNIISELNDEFGIDCNSLLKSIEKESKSIEKENLANPSTNLSLGDKESLLSHFTNKVINNKSSNIVSASSIPTTKHLFANFMIENIKKKISTVLSNKIATGWERGKDYSVLIKYIEPANSESVREYYNKVIDYLRHNGYDAELIVEEIDPKIIVKEKQKILVKAYSYTIKMWIVAEYSNRKDFAKGSVIE